MAATGDEQLPVGAQRARDVAVATDAGDDVLDRRPERRILHPQRVAVQIGQLVRRRPEAVLVDQPVAAGRLADGAVVERLGAGGDERADRERDECEPAADREPGPPRAPAPDRRDRPHAATLCRGGRVPHVDLLAAADMAAAAATAASHRCERSERERKGRGRTMGSPAKRFSEPVAVSSTAPAGFPTPACAFPVRPSDAASTYSRSVLAAHGNLRDRSRSDKTRSEQKCAQRCGNFRCDCYSETTDGNGPSREIQLLVPPSGVSSGLSRTPSKESNNLCKTFLSALRSA